MAEWFPAVGRRGAGVSRPHAAATLVVVAAFVELSLVFSDQPK